MNLPTVDYLHPFLILSEYFSAKGKNPPIRYILIISRVKLEGTYTKYRIASRVPLEAIYRLLEFAPLSDSERAEVNNFLGLYYLPYRLVPSFGKGYEIREVK